MPETVTWRDVLSRTPGLPLAAVRAALGSAIRSWEMAGHSSEALDPGEGRGEALAELREKAAFLDQHVAAELPAYLPALGQPVRVAMVTASGPVLVEGTLDQRVDLVVRSAAAVREDIPHPAWLVTTPQGVPVWIWQDRILDLEQRDQ